MTTLFSIFDFNLSDFIATLLFNPKQPLLFNSEFFLKFFIVFYAGYVILRSDKLALSRKIYLILFSLYFYYKAGGFSLPISLFGVHVNLNYSVIILVCALATDWMARKMYEAKTKKAQKIWLTTIIVGNLSMLAYFKYTGFLFGNLNNLFDSDLILYLAHSNDSVAVIFTNINDVLNSWSVPNLILPIGISFFVFEAISYAVDLYRKEMEPARSTLDFCFYIAFFPKLVAGPIIRAKDFLPQMYNKMHLTRKMTNHAIFLIIIGLIKKAIISDYISTNFVNRVFDSPMSYTSIENLLAVYGYTLQIYCDFSGYSDIAIGLSLLMGFTIPANFFMPYKSQSVTEFWRRWHISLSSWLRDYLYISVGGNRKGKIRTYVNLFLTMLIGGLWHGASWTFVVWGALHGLLLVIERFIKQFIPLSSEKRLPRAIRVFITFHLIAFCWIFFRASTFESASNIILNIGKLSFAPSDWLTVIVGYKNVFILVAIGYLMHFLSENFIEKIKTEFGRCPLIFKGVLLGLVMWLIYATMSSGPQPFIYFQF